MRELALLLMVIQSFFLLLSILTDREGMNELTFGGKLIIVYLAIVPLIVIAAFGNG